MLIGREHPPHWHQKAATLVSKLEDPSADETVKHKAAEALCKLLGERRIFESWNAESWNAARAYVRKCKHAQNVARDNLNTRSMKRMRGEEDLRREASRLRGVTDA